MTLPLNQICLSGWLLGEVRSEGSSVWAFDLLQHPYHESFRRAEEDAEAGIIVKVQVTFGDIVEDCREYLAKGSRVTVCGQLAGRGRTGLVIDAFQVERSEILKNLRYFNHPWHRPDSATDPAAATGMRTHENRDTPATHQENSV